jgi:hypothetical protein
LSQFLKLAQKGLIIQSGFPLGKRQNLGDVQKCEYERDQKWLTAAPRGSGYGLASDGIFPLVQNIMPTVLNNKETVENRFLRG